MKKYKVRYDNWDDFGHKLTRYLILDGSYTSFTIKLIGEDENPVVSVFISIGEQKSFEAECKRLNIDYDEIYKVLKLDKYSIGALNDIRKKESVNYDAYINSFCRNQDTEDYIMNLLNTKRNSNININVFEKNLNFSFSSVNSYRNKMLCIIGKNGSRKSTLLRELFYKYSEYNPEDFVWNIGIVKNSFQPEKAIFISYGLFDKVNYQGDNFIFDIAQLVETNEFEELLKKYHVEKEKIKSYLEKHFTFSKKMQWESNEDIQRTYEQLSTGEKYAFLFVVVIVGEIRTNSLIFIDELEVSQHPQQIIRMQYFLNEILHEKNSYAILATHSPYLVQNIPSDHVLISSNEETNLDLKRFPLETFGLSYDEIARIVFEVKEADKLYVKAIKEMDKEQKNEILQNSARSLPFEVEMLLRRDDVQD